MFGTGVGVSVSVGSAVALGGAAVAVGAVIASGAVGALVTVWPLHAAREESAATIRVHRKIGLTSIATLDKG